MLSSNDSLYRSFTLLESWRERLQGDEPVDELDASTYELHSTISEQLVSDLIVLAAAGCELEISFPFPAVTLRAHTLPTGELRFETPDDLGLAFDGTTLLELEAAIQNDDLRRVAAILGIANIDIDATLRMDPVGCGFHWIRTAQSFLAQVNGIGWTTLLHRLFANSDTATLVVDDGGNNHIATRSLSIRGPQSEYSTSGPAGVHYARTYAEVILADRPIRMPPMSALYPIQINEWAELSGCLSKLAAYSGWWWLADSVTVGLEHVDIQFNGARITSVNLNEIGPASPSDLYALWNWAVEASDHDRRYAVQQAASLAIFTPADLNTSPTPILRTARSIYGLARRGAVAEAVATRRTIRTAAVDAAFEASEAARNTTVKALERVVVQAGAAAGIVIANIKQVLTSNVTAKLLAIVGVLALLTTIIVILVEYKTAAAGLRAFREDVNRYADTLSSDDLADVLNMRSLTTARVTMRMCLAAIIAVSGLVQGALWYTIFRISHHHLSLLWK